MITCMMMPAPVANVQTNIQAAASDQVPETDVLLQLLLDESTAAFDFHGFDEEISGNEEELLEPAASPDSLAMYEYLAQNGTYDMSEAPISDQANQDGANGVPEDGAMEDEEWFVPLVPGRLQCSDCRVVRQIRVQTGKHAFILMLLYICKIDRNICSFLENFLHVLILQRQKKGSSVSTLPPMERCNMRSLIADTLALTESRLQGPNGCTWSKCLAHIFPCLQVTHELTNDP
jgi:hypothetical protein